MVGDIIKKNKKLVKNDGCFIAGCEVEKFNWKMDTYSIGELETLLGD